MPDAIDKLTALFEAATKGEWVAPGNYTVYIGSSSKGVLRVDYFDDAAYIAHAHNLMPRILDVMRALNKMLHPEPDDEPRIDMTVKLYDFDALDNALDALQEGGE